MKTNKNREQYKEKILEHPEYSNRVSGKFNLVKTEATVIKYIFSEVVFFKDKELCAILCIKCQMFLKQKNCFNILQSL